MNIYKNHTALLPCFSDPLNLIAEQLTRPQITRAAGPRRVSEASQKKEAALYSPSVPFKVLGTSSSTTESTQLARGFVGDHLLVGAGLEELSDP
jgi:hypothetical protein